MPSTTQKIATDHVAESEQAPMPARPEPLVPDHLSLAYDAGANARTELAAAFRRMGRGVSARYAYEQAKTFYRASGHAWARKLTRQIG